MNLEPYRVPAVEGASRVLLFVGGCAGPVSLSQIPAATGLTRTTARRVVGSLVLTGFLETESDDQLKLGWAARRLGYLAQEQLGVRHASRGALAWLVRELGETAHVGIAHRGKVEFIDVVDSPEPTQMASRPGVLVDAYCSATGKVLMAAQPEFLETVRGLHRRKFPARTANTITDWPTLMVELARVSENGYGVDEQEFHQGVRCVAVPVIDAASRTVAAIGVTASVKRLPRRRVGAVAKAIAVASARMTAALGALEVHADIESR